MTNKARVTSLFFILITVLLLGNFAYSSYAVNFHFENNSAINFINMPNGIAGINLIKTENKIWSDDYGSVSCALVPSGYTAISHLYTNEKTNDFMIVPSTSDGDTCSDLMGWQEQNYGFQSADFAYQFTDEAGQQFISLLSVPQALYDCFNDDSWRTHYQKNTDLKMTAGNISFFINREYKYNGYGYDDLTRDSFATIKNQNLWLIGDKPLSLSAKYLGKFNDPGDKTNTSNIYKFTINHTIGLLTGAAPQNQQEGDLDYAGGWSNNLPRGQNFSIIFSPYEVEASNDNQNWYHLGYVLPQGMPEHGNDNGKDIFNRLNTGDAVFYFTPEKMTVPAGQANAGAQFKYFKVRQWLKTHSDPVNGQDPTIVESAVSSLPEPINPFPSIIGVPSSYINHDGSQNIKVNANIIAQTQITYDIQNYSDTNTIKNPSAYAYFLLQNNQDMGIVLASNSYLITNLFDPNDIAPLAIDPRKANYPNINKDHYLAITNLKGQYQYNPVTNSALLHFNNITKLTGVLNDSTTYYISTGKETNQSSNNFKIVAKSGAVSNQTSTLTIINAINTAFNNTNPAFTFGNLAVANDGRGYKFTQNLNNAYSLGMYNPKNNLDENNNPAPISYLFFDVNRNGYINNDTLACNATNGQSCASVVPYTVIMNKYLALEWFAILHNGVMINFGGDTNTSGFINPNPSWAGCEINVNNGGGSFYTSGINGRTCFDVHLDAPSIPLDPYHINGFPNWDWFNQQGRTSKADNAPKYLSTTITDTAGDVLVITNSKFIPPLN